MRSLVLGVLIFSLTSCSTIRRQPLIAPANDEFLWLEEIEGSKAISWVKKQNDQTLQQLKADPRYSETEKDIEKILANKDRIPEPELHGNFVYNHWTDDQHPRGLWRRCSIQEFQSQHPQWELILDIDELGKKENESWVFHGADILPPENKRALVHLSRGGKDAVEVREFDLQKKVFIQDGFFLPEAKSRVSWIDENTLLVATDFGPGSMTTSGYPRIVKKWHRGQNLNQAEIILEGQPEDMATEGYTIFRPEGIFTFVQRNLNFYEYKKYFLTSKNELKLITIPEKASISGVFKERLYFTLVEDWTTENQNFSSGSLVSFDFPHFIKTGKLKTRLEYQPDSKSSLMNVTITKSKIWLEISHNVKPSVYELISSRKLKRVAMPEIGTASVSTADPYSDDLFLNYSNFLVPPSLYFLKANQLKKIKSLPAQFNSKDLVIEQLESISKDGTHIPYFLVRKKATVLNGKNPTLLNAYGGFQVAMTPAYSAVLGKTWLERGGIYALANIRGGGEFGPRWHRAALKENRQKAYDDFFSVAEDLIQRKITTQSKLVLRGGSNGGLLMGVAFTQRPNLFKAVICEVPLLDMMRYHLLLAGASWMAEYGNPDIPSERSFIEKYSPYQNVKPDVKYPKVFFTTSTKDDRVHPGHARKMAALFEKYHLPYLYYENIEGGHGAAADLKQRAQYLALQTIFMLKEVMD